MVMKIVVVDEAMVSKEDNNIIQNKSCEVEFSGSCKNLMHTKKAKWKSYRRGGGGGRKGVFFKELWRCPK